MTNNLSNEIKRLRLEGLTYNQIKQKLGCSKGTIAYYLGEGQKDKQIARAKDSRYKRLQKVADLKKVPCLDCNGLFPTECMDFDHVRGIKIDTISNLVAHGSWQDVLDEIEKCEVVCANCHRIRTKSRGDAGWGYMT